VFGYLGQLNPNKGVATLVDAFVRADISGARLRLAGRGMLAESLGARNVPGVELLGWVGGEEREAFFAGIDCLAVCSEWPEPGATVVAEAKARGIPVIGTTIGCLPEVVPAACRALLAPIADPDVLAQSLRSYADDPAAYLVGPGDVQMDRVLHVDRVLDVYGETIAAHRSGASAVNMGTVADRRQTAW
jgi:glycosyltransferase involved in cell wall biosynthesis